MDKKAECMSKTVDCTIRPLHPDETCLLKEFLYEAIFIPEGEQSPPRTVVDLPELSLYVENFGERKDDLCLVADYKGRVIGAAWCRIMPDYGHVDNQTPSLSISLYKPYRNKGIGSRLMHELFNALKQRHYQRLSLSVQKENYAARWYIQLGFKIVKETQEEYVMVKELHEPENSYRRFLAGEYGNRLNEDVLRMITETKAYLAILNDARTPESQRGDILGRMLGAIGKHSHIGPHFTCQCGKHIFIGEKTIVNANCTMMDENLIRIGNRVLIAPHVQLYTATHPLDVRERFVDNWDEASGELFFRTKALPITIGDNVWIGGGAILLAGVTIGENSIVGAGSVVTQSIPANCIAAGNPCRVIKRMNTDFDIRELSRVDAPRMCEMFRETVLHVNSQDYTREEVEDWASCGDSVEHMEELLSNNRYVGAFDKQNHIIGFSSMNASGYLHSMFVHKEWQKKGIASALLMQVERYAKEYGVSEISAEVSITARPFFEKRGYRVIKVQKQRANKLHLTNYWMKKQIPANG